VLDLAEVSIPLQVPAATEEHGPADVTREGRSRAPSVPGIGACLSAL
jgi:hypothetical protein